MNETIINAANALDALANAIIAALPPEQPLNEVGWGWTAPAASSRELARRPIALAQRIRNLPSTKLDEDFISQITKIPPRVIVIQQTFLPNVAGGNAHYYNGVIDPFFEWIDSILPPITGDFDWENVERNALVPRKITQKLRALDAQITGISFDRDELLSKFELINRTHAAAESYPADLEELKRQRDVLSGIIAETRKQTSDIDDISTAVSVLLQELQRRKSDADAIVAKCEEAYRASTTQGLASAFSERAKELTILTYVWLAVLICCLLGAMHIGGMRISYIQELISKKADIQIIFASSMLSVFVLAAPIWLAWLSTKQISQRFRLTEDYAFKASFAKAYEGYRTEAVNLDPLLAKRLFEAAINRIDESPVRLIDQHSPGSPLHELLPFRSILPMKSTETKIIPDG